MQRAADGQARRGQWRRALRWAILPAALLAAYLAFRTPEPARTAFKLLAAVCNLRSPRAREPLLDTYVAEALTLELEDPERGWSKRRLSRSELLEQLDELEQSRPRCQLELEVSAVHGADGSPWLDGELQFSESQAGDLHAEWRSVRAQFESVGARYRLVRLSLGAPERSLPEARP